MFGVRTARLVGAFGLAFPFALAAQSVPITGGAPATETFDSLVSSGTGSTLPSGWAFVESGSNANTTFAADAGATNSGNTYSYGPASSSDRALGGLRSNSLVPTFGARLRNDTGATLGEIQIEYDGEQWRVGQLGRVDRLDFQYSLDATSLTTGTWIDVDALDFTAPVTTGTADSALDGNANSVSKSAIVSSLALAADATIWVRWNDFSASGADDGLAIDNFVVSVPGDNPPGVSSTSPADGALDVAPGTNLTITFSEPVTTSGEWFTIACPPSAPRTVADTVVSGTGASRTIDPNVDFGAEETCTVTIEAANVTDLDGTADAMLDNHRFGFTIAAAPVDVPPAVDTITPAHGATNVATNTSITVKFTEAVTAPASAFTIACSGSGAHAFALAPSSGAASTFVLDPSVDFDEVETCTLEIDAAQVLDQDGTIDAMVADFLASFTTRAGAGSYYDSVDASSCVALRTSLHALIDDHQVLPYTGSPADVWTMIEAGDADPSASGKVLDIYFNKSFTAVTDRDNGTSQPQGTRYNREHTWPQSRGFPDTNGNLGFPNAPRSDGHHLFASEKDWNAARGNRPFAACAPPTCSSRYTLTHPITGGAGSSANCTYASGNCNWVGGNDDNTGSFEVWAARRGDVARGVLYMDVRYEGGTAGPDSNTPGQTEPDLVVTETRSQMVLTSGGTAYMGVKSALLAWHAADPPDAYESLRNDAIFSYQGNRNPFIDHPEWVAIAFADPCDGTAPANQAPTLADVSVSVLENAANGTVVTTLAATDPDAGQTLTYSIVGATGPFAINGATGAVSVADTTLVDPAVAPSYVLTVRATDNGSPTMSDDATLTISVTPVNDAPTFTKGPDVAVLEDAGAQSIAGWIVASSPGPSDEGAQTLAYEVTSNTNGALFAQGPTVTGGTLAFTPAPDAHGSATIALRIRDSGGTENGGIDVSGIQTFLVTVAPVNDAPSFTKGADQTVDADSGAASIAGWATGISAGPANESGQVVSFELVSNSNAALFSAQPAVASNGTLTFTPAAGAFGQATIELRARDDGGTDNGGINLSPSQSFTITVDEPAGDTLADAVNDAATVVEDSLANPIDVLANDEDVDGDEFFVTGVTQGANGTAAVGANGVSVTFTPASDFCGATSFGYTITGGDSATVSVTVTCVNDAPVAVDASGSVVAGSDIGTAVATVSASDVDGTVTFAITGGNSGGAFAIDASSGAVTVANPVAVQAPASPFVLTVTASDDGTPALSDTATVTITVTARGDAVFGDGFE